MENGAVMAFELYPDVAPKSVANFVKLAKSGFYDGLTFHRIVPGFVIQGGDPDGNGTGGPGWTIPGEFRSNGFRNDLKHERGVLSWARTADPNSAGSQFFIMGALIGRKGETLDAIQYLTGIVINREEDERWRVNVDTEGYRAKREGSLEELAQRTAAKALKYKKPVALEPMNAHAVLLKADCGPRGNSGRP